MNKQTNEQMIPMGLKGVKWGYKGIGLRRSSDVIDGGRRIHNDSKSKLYPSCTHHDDINVLCNEHYLRHVHLP